MLTDNWRIWIVFLSLCIGGCAQATVKAVGDPDRPITINAHITIDIKGLQNTAANIEDYVSGEQSIDKVKGE